VRRNPPEAEDSTILAGSRAALPSEQLTCSLALILAVRLFAPTYSHCHCHCNRALALSQASLSAICTALSTQPDRIRVTCLGKTGYSVHLPPLSLYPAAAPVPAPRPAAASKPHRSASRTRDAGTDGYLLAAVISTASRSPLPAIPSSYRPLVILEKWGA
jgi:hypothetical protein